MFIIGQSLHSNSHNLIYAVFEHKNNLENWLLNNNLAALEPMKIIEIDSISFPFFIFEDSLEGVSYYQYINKNQFGRKLSELRKINDPEIIYFNLWRIEHDTFNKQFPTEPCLNGSHYHLHFMNHDLQQIALDGLDNYWSRILTGRLENN